MTEKLERAFNHFVEFGNLLDRSSRRYLVQYFRDKIERANEDHFSARLLEVEHGTRVSPNLKEQYFRYLRSALDRILAIDDLLPLMTANERITEQIVLDTLYWIRKTFTKVATKHPHKDEVELLDGWSVTPLKVFRVRYPFLLQKLREKYTKQELDPGFYENRFAFYLDREYADLNQAEKDKFELLFTDLLGQWDALLQAKILAYQLKHLEKEENNLLIKLSPRLINNSLLKCFNSKLLL